MLGWRIVTIRSHGTTKGADPTQASRGFPNRPTPGGFIPEWRAGSNRNAARDHLGMGGRHHSGIGGRLAPKSAHRRHVRFAGTCLVKPSLPVSSPAGGCALRTALPSAPAGCRTALRKAFLITRRIGVFEKGRDQAGRNHERPEGPMPPSRRDPANLGAAASGTDRARSASGSPGCPGVGSIRIPTCRNSPYYPYQSG